VLSRTLNKKQMLMSVATKIAIQLNCKMGGEVWALEIPVVMTCLLCPLRVAKVVLVSHPELYCLAHFFLVCGCVKLTYCLRH